jgi:hypothetical protein
MEKDYTRRKTSLKYYIRNDSIFLKDGCILELGKRLNRVTLIVDNSFLWELGLQVNFFLFPAWTKASGARLAGRLPLSWGHP